MSFIGDAFTFDNISSERFGLKITTPDSKSTINVSSYKSNLIKTKRQSKFHPTKRTIDEPLVLEISIFSETPLTRNQIDRIEDWLFSDDDNFKKLRINQEDMQGYYYNCRLQKLESETFGNVPYICYAVMECDSVFIWQNLQTRVFSTITTPYEFKFVNISSEDTLKPIYTITCNSPLGIIKITDTTTTEYIELTGLSNGEIITINTEYEIITSNMRTSGLLDLFNKNFIRLKRGTHNFKLEGNISEFKMIYQNARKIGN